jgi:hypothetical protein
METGHSSSVMRLWYEIRDPKSTADLEYERWDQVPIYAFAIMPSSVSKPSLDSRAEISESYFIHPKTSIWKKYSISLPSCLPLSVIS